jgi:peptidoglycan/xylan/chitin deacetylase (PgdA/CDA1 family)
LDFNFLFVKFTTNNTAKPDMKGHESIRKMVIINAIMLAATSWLQAQLPVGHTEITKWQYGRNGAVSITYDDGSINQFLKAVPVMNNLNFPGTFFINTGSVPGSKYKGRFIGRPVKSIIEEAKTIPTGKANVYERASAARYLGYRGTSEYFTKAGAQIDAGRYDEAYKIIDELYSKVNNGDFKPDTATSRVRSSENVLTWDMIKTYVSQGHEFASHMVTHPYMAALDEVNIMYELEKSREEILNQLGPKYTFSAECPYGTEDERAMEYAHRVYPALRNRMPEKFLLELNRPSRKSPVSNSMEYVQWQRGATTKTPMPMMKAWVDTTAARENIWLVLVIHGVEGIGWEALTSQSIDEYFSYIKSKENDLWVATFADATKYMRERMNAEVKTSDSKGKIIVSLTHPLDKSMYDLPVTLKTYVSPDWKEVVVKQGNETKKIRTQLKGKETYVLYQAVPNSGNIEISGI